MEFISIDVKTKAPVLKFFNTHQPFDLHKQVKKTWRNLTCPLPKNGTEWTRLFEFVLFYLEINDIILENVCSWRWNSFIINDNVFRNNTE